MVRKRLENWDLQINVSLFIFVHLRRNGTKSFLLFLLEIQKFIYHMNSFLGKIQIKGKLFIRYSLIINFNLNYYLLF